MRRLVEPGLSPSITACLLGGRRPADPAEGDLHKRLKHRALPVVRQRLPHRLTDLAHGVTPAIEPAREARRGRSSAVEASRSNYQRHHEWDIELFFKWIKQHLRIKQFYGTSENAVKTQIWIAVSVYVLVAIVRKRLKLEASLYTLLQVFSVTVFEKLLIRSALLPEATKFDAATDVNQLNLFAI